MSVNLAAASAARGIATDLVVVERTGPFADAIDPRVRVVELMPGGGRAATAIPRLAAYLRRERPVALVTVLNHASVAAIVARAIARSGTRIVVTVHNQMDTDAELSMAERLRRVLMRWTFPRADAVVAVSEGVARSVRRTLALTTGAVVTVPNPVVSEALLRRASAQPTHPWFGDDGPPIAIAIGRLVEQKDYPTLLDAFAMLQRGRACRLLILGDGPDRGTIESHARTLGLRLGLDGDVDLPGFVDEPYPALRNAAVFVSSSRWEGLPTVHIEALALGVPVVATDCESGPSEILRDGRYGLLVPVGDASALAAALGATLDGRHPYLAGEFVASDAVAPYTVEASLAGYLSVAGIAHEDTLAHSSAEGDAATK